MARLEPLWTASATDDLSTIRELLAPLGVTLERWTLPPEAAELAAQPAMSDDDKGRVLALFRQHLDEVAADHGYIDADVVAVRNVEGVEQALARFDKVHFHEDDEVRAIVGGTGVFGVIADDGRQALLHVEAGDYICVPAGLWHWFYCHSDKNITAIRLFKDTSGWTPHYRPTERGQA